MEPTLTLTDVVLVVVVLAIHEVNT